MLSLDNGRTRLAWVTPDPDKDLPKGMEALADAIRASRKRESQLGGANRKLGDLRSQMHEAYREDQQATVKAIREGKADPGPRLAEAIQKRIGQLEQMVEGHTLLVLESQKALTAVARETAAENEAAIAAMEAETRATISAAVDQIAAVFGGLEREPALRGFVAEAAKPPRSGSGPVVRYWRPALRVLGIRRANGDPYSLDAVLDAVRRIGEPEEDTYKGPKGPLLSPETGESMYVG